jgi:hypothetical protein
MLYSIYINIINEARFKLYNANWLLKMIKEQEVFHGEDYSYTEWRCCQSVYY